jgi:TolB-like protein/DNA-binding winged helix-turn-helix (wHTH) protein/Tfp pilus assembly protein PilF
VDSAWSVICILIEVLAILCAAFQLQIFFIFEVADRLPFTDAYSFPINAVRKRGGRAKLPHQGPNGVEIVATPVSINRTWRFGVYEVDTRRVELRRNGTAIKLREQPFSILVHLLEHAGEIVSREELRRVLWPSDTFVDFDHSLSMAVMNLREALGDSSDSPLYIETIPKRGYRFIAPVTTGSDSRNQHAYFHEEADPLPILETVRANHTAPTPTETTNSGRLPRLTSAAIGLTILAVVGLLVFLRTRATPVQPPHIHALAVLPLENLSNAPDQEYFSDGMTVALITELGKIGGPRIISRQSVMQFKGSKKPLKEIARELGVDALVEGAVERSGDRIRISVHLEQVEPERQIWGQEYDRDLRDVLALQAEIARSIAGEIRVNLSPEELRSLASRKSINPEAHSEYLQGFYDTAGLASSTAHFKKSIQLDPTFAPAYAELAINYFWEAHPGNGELPVKEMLPLATQAVRKALQLDPSLPQGHLAMGLLATSDYNWAEAEAQYKEALAINPNYSECRHQYGVLFEGQGRNAEAVAQVRLAIEMDPLSAANRNQSAVIAYTSRNYDLAIAQFEKLHEDAWKEPLALAYAQNSMFAKALANMQNCDDAGCLAVRADIYGVAGRPQEAVEIIRQLQEYSRTHYVFPSIFARAYLAAGYKEQALTWFERAYDEKDPWLFWLKVWPTLDSIRSEPRFQALLRKVNYSQ